MTHTFMMQTGMRASAANDDLILLKKYNLPTFYSDTFGLDIVRFNDAVKVPDDTSIETHLTRMYSRKVADATRRLLSPRYEKIEQECRPAMPGVVINKVSGIWKLSHIESGQSMGSYRLLRHAKECAAELSALSIDWESPIANLYTFPDFKDKVQAIVTSYQHR